MNRTRVSAILPQRERRRRPQNWAGLVSQMCGAGAGPSGTGPLSSSPCFIEVSCLSAAQGQKERRKKRCKLKRFKKLRFGRWPRPPPLRCRGRAELSPLDPIHPRRAFLVALSSSSAGLVSFVPLRGRRCCRDGRRTRGRRAMPLPVPRADVSRRLGTFPGQISPSPSSFPFLIASWPALFNPRPSPFPFHLPPPPSPIPSRRSWTFRPRSHRT